MSQNIKRIFEKQGFIRLKGVLNYKEDLEPILNDMIWLLSWIGLFIDSFQKIIK